jgi:hypothetical protein
MCFFLLTYKHARMRDTHSHTYILFCALAALLSDQMTRPLLETQVTMSLHPMPHYACIGQPTSIFAAPASADVRQPSGMQPAPCTTGLNCENCADLCQEFDFGGNIVEKKVNIS